MRQALSRVVADVGIGAIAAAAFVAVGAQHLAVDTPATIAAKVVEVDRMDHGIGFRVSNNGRDHAEPAVRFVVAVFVKQTDSTEVPAILQVLIAVDIERTLAFECAKQTKAQRSALAGNLCCAEQIAGLNRLPQRQTSAGREYGSPWTPADTPGVDEGEPLRAGGRARCGVEDVLTFKKEQAFLGEEGLVRGQVHCYIVGFHGAEIRIESCSQLQVCRRSPEQVGAGFETSLLIDPIVGR